MFWISIKDSLPKLKRRKGCVNGVLALMKGGVECGYRIMVTNVEYLLNHQDKFTHWCNFPKFKEK